MQTAAVGEAGMTPSSSPINAKSTASTVVNVNNPFDTPESDSESVIIEDSGVVASISDIFENENRELSSEPKCCLDTPFSHECQNLNNSSPDNLLLQQRRPQEYYHCPNVEEVNPVVCSPQGGNRELVLVPDDRNKIGTKNEMECSSNSNSNNYKDDNNRRTVVTKEVNTWGENLYSNDNHDNDDLESNEHPHDAANNYYRHHAATTTSHREVCLHCLIRIVRRMCHPHIHPPCSRRYWSNNGNNSNITSPPEQHRHHQRILCRTLIILFMIVTITFTLLDLLILHQYLHQWLDSTLEWLHSNPISGGLALIGIILMGCLCFFPVALLSLGAGYVYIELYGLGLGIFVAFLVCFAGYLLGAVVCFARSRFLMRQLIIRYAAKYPIVKAVDRAFETKGFRLLLLLRLSPAMPMNALNYIGGITAISFSSYWWATCVGTFPGLLWTIFVGATFGTVDARGVDGNKEFDRNSVRKGVVLGLGIGLGVVALIGTAIYARMELKKIILAEQMERVIEEQELFMHNEIEGGLEDEEDDDDRGSMLVDDLENPQTGDWDGLSNNRRRSSSHCSFTTLGQHGGATQHPWTPETVDAELPILPKVILRCLARPNDEVVTTTVHERGGEANPASIWPDLYSPKIRQRTASASASPLHHQRHSSEASKIRAETSRSVAVNVTSPTIRRRSDDIPKGVLMSTPEVALRADASSDTVNEMMSSLANIYETRALSDDQLFDEADGDANHVVTSPHVYNETVYRRRCNTDPTDRRQHESQDVEASTYDSAITTQGKKRWQQSSPMRTPSPRKQQDMNTRHSFGSLQRGQGDLNCDDEHFPQRPRSKSLTIHHPQGMSQHESSIVAPHELSSVGGNVGLNISDRGDDDDNSTDTPREWFWIWS